MVVRRINLMEDSFSSQERRAIEECLNSGRYTQGKRVKDFEDKFAKWNGSLAAVMVNSGSSANLLIIEMLKYKYGLQDGDEVIVPAVTWPTTVYPLLQCNLVPVFCDVDETFSLDIESIKRMVSSKTKALFLVHLLGQPANMSAIENFCNLHDLVLVEDNCESTGAMVNGKKTGSFGVMSSFSFYFGHHMTTIEGGMITTNDLDTADLLRSMRSHGWVRGSTRAEKYLEQGRNIDFLFDMPGYNVRSSDLNAAIGLVQLQKIDSWITIRRENHRLFSSLLQNNPHISLQKVNIDQTSSFSLAIILSSPELRDALLQELPKKGIECRPLVAGNLLTQPVFRSHYNGKFREDECSYSKIIDSCGMYVPNNQFMGSDEIKYMVGCILEIVTK